MSVLSAVMQNANFTEKYFEPFNAVQLHSCSTKVEP